MQVLILRWREHDGEADRGSAKGPHKWTIFSTCCANPQAPWLAWRSSL